MTYAIDIQGMHCPGCIGLVTLSLQELGYQGVNVTEGAATFETDVVPTDITMALDRLFAGDLHDYHYTNFHLVTQPA